MIDTWRGQDIGFLCWTSVKGDAWLTDCVPLSMDYDVAFEWSDSGEVAPPGEEDDEDTRTWGDASLESLAHWMNENPY